MKTFLILSGLVAALFVADQAHAQLNPPPSLVNELTGQPVSSTTTKCVILIHGWNPDGYANFYTLNTGFEWFNLLTNLKAKLNGSSWNIITYHWETDANTGPIWDAVNNLFDPIPPNQASANAYGHGDYLATKLNTIAPNLREVHFIAHSAGSWAAQEAAKQLLILNPYVIVQVTLLDPYIPDPYGFVSPNFSDNAMSVSAYASAADRVQRLENYYADDSVYFNPSPWGGLNTFLTLKTQERFNWRSGQDINQEVDWGALTGGIPRYRPNYDWHSGPIQFYSDCISADLFPSSIPAGLQGVGCPFDYRAVGWTQSLFVSESSLPQITGQPSDKSAQVGGQAVFSVTVNNASDISWYKINGSWVGSGAVLTLNSVTQNDGGSYVARVSNSSGTLFSQPAQLTVGAASLSITSVSPVSLITSSSPQLLQILGTGFTASSTLLFNGNIASDPSRLIFKNANEIDYNIIVQSSGTWSVQAVNGGQTSNTKNFSVNSPSATTGSLVVNLSPATSGGQWQVDGTGYNNSGFAVGYLAPGGHTVSFKPISGYTPPSDMLVNIISGQQTTTNATYTPATQTTYTLTLNYNGGQGTASASPIASGNVYNSGSIIQLTAYANSGYHFTSWSGDLTATSNPATVTMNGNKNIVANFASGDPGLGTISVTLSPSAALAAGAQWKYNSSDWTNSGASITTPLIGAPQNYLQFKTVPGWVTPSPFYVTVNGGQTTNVSVTYQQDTTPALVTMTLSPPDAVSAGAHWHVNGGTYGNGSSVSLPPGNYSVTFDNAAGWTAPISQPLTVNPGQAINLSGVYTPPAGQPAIYTVSPAIGALQGGTLLTINGVNFTPSASVTIGGRAATNVSVIAPTQITCITPPGNSNGTVPVVIQANGGSATNVNGFAYGMARGQKLAFVSSTGGMCYCVAIQGNYAYLGEGRNLVVVNISNPSSPARVGQLTLPGIVADVALFSNFACVADGEGGLQMVDISAPTTPTLVGFNSSTNFQWAGAIKILGGRAYVADVNGLGIYDLGNPNSPSLVSVTGCGGALNDVVLKASVNGVFAYVAVGSSLQVVDISNPASPTLRGSVALGGSPYSITIAGNYVYAATANAGSDLKIIDITNPDAPTIAGPAPNIVDSVSVTSANNVVYALSDVDGYGFYTFNVNGSSLLQAANLPHVTSSGYGCRLVISGNYAFIAAGTSGLKIVSIANVYSPTLTSTFTDGGVVMTPTAAAVSGNVLCAANGDVKFFDITQPSSPVLLSQLSGIGGNCITAGNGFAYGIGNGGIKVINITTPSSPQVVATISNSVVNAYWMQLAGTTLYIGGQNSANQARFVAVNVSNPSSPTVLGIKDFTDLAYSYARRIAVNGNTAIIGIPYDNSLRVLDISNIASPQQVGTVTNTSFSNGIRISGDGNYVYSLNGSSVSVIVLTNRATPRIVANFSPDSSFGMLGMTSRNNDLYVSTYWGIYGYDVSTPSSPNLKRSYSVLAGPDFDVVAPTDSLNQSVNVYVADSNGGVVALREQDTQTPNVYITSPVFGSVYTNTSSTISLGGGSDDNVGVTAISWANDRGGSGQVSAPLDNWYVTGIALYPGSNNVTVTAYDAAGNRGTSTLTVIYQPAKQNQTITFQPVADHSFGDAPVQLAAAASSALPVAFSVISGPASVSNNILTLLGAGTITVQASQPGNSFFNASPSTNITFNVARANQAITFAPVPNKSAGDPPFALVASSSSGLTPYFSILSGPATITDSSSLTLLGAGTVTVVAYQPGNSDFNAAPIVQRSFTVAKVPQTITFGGLPPQKIGDAPFALNAVASSGLPVTFSVAGAATLTGNIVTLTGFGTLTITASQPGNSAYAPASDVIQTVTVYPQDSALVGLGVQKSLGFQLAFYGGNGTNYSLETSSNLIDWFELTNFTLTTSPMFLNDSSATNMPFRFYRTLRH